jgi:hypothetical protein
MNEPAKLAMADILDYGPAEPIDYTALAKQAPSHKDGDTARFLNMVTLQEATFVRVRVSGSGLSYWQQEGTTGMLTESQMTVARWHAPARYTSREAFLRASVKWTMKAARRATGDRQALVRQARERHHEVVHIVRERRAYEKSMSNRWRAILTLQTERNAALKEARKAEGEERRNHVVDARLYHRAALSLISRQTLP